MQPDVIYVRGIPMLAWEVIQHQDRLGAQLFDESMFATIQKKQACANVIVALDIALRKYLEKEGWREVPDEKIIVIDIGDPAWKYIPVKLFPSDGIVTVARTKDSPAGKVAWFRMKRMFAVRKTV